MKTVNLFEFNQVEIGTARQARAIKNGKTALQLIRHGSKGANPVAAWLDAAISVADAINSYCKLQQAREVSKQLLSQKKALQHQIRNLSQTLELDRSLWQLEQQQRLSLIHDRIKANQQQAQQLLTQLASQHQSLEMLYTQVRALRRQSNGQCDRLKTLTQAADAMMQAQLGCLVYALD